MKISCLNDLIYEAKKISEKTVIAVVEAQDENTLQAVVEAAQDGIIAAVLIGDAEKIKRMLRDFDAAPSDFSIIKTESVIESLRIAVELIHAGKAHGLMQGRLETNQYVKAIITKENGLMTGEKLTLVDLFETPRYDKLFAVSDMALNTFPDLEGKKSIIENAVKLMHAIGCRTPMVAVLSSVEEVDQKMPDTIDGERLKRMNLNGEISGCVVEGPISFNLAISREAAEIKGYESPVAGEADILIVPDVVSGNILATSITTFGVARLAGLAVGAKVPVIITSHSAEAADDYYSIALAACVASDF